MIMTLTGKQKAAMLLMNLDSASAAELLKGFDPKVVEELAVELAYLDASGKYQTEHGINVAQEFYTNLVKGEGFDCKSFISEMLKNSVGSEKSERIKGQIDDLLHKRDPFLAIKSADAKTIVTLLKNEHPKAIAIVLSELDPGKSSEVLNLLGEDIRLSVVSRMTSSESISDETKNKIGQMLTTRLNSIKQQKGAVPDIDQDENLRNVAVILRNLEKEVRDGLIQTIKKKDKNTAKQVMELMIIWDDICQIEDRSLQQALRNIEEKTLALALINADEKIEQKIKENISERAAETLEEEKSLMGDPSKADIEKARNEMVEALREENKNGELKFIEKK